MDKLPKCSKMVFIDKNGIVVTKQVLMYENLEDIYYIMRTRDYNVRCKKLYKKIDLRECLSCSGIKDKQTTF
jgi:hypothetical protein